MSVNKGAWTLHQENVKTFETGAVRSKDADGVRYDLISPVALEEIAKTYHEGAHKYGDHNWLKGMPVSDLLNHAIRHIYIFLSGDRDEPHLAHAAWGLLAAIHSDKMWPHLNGNLLGLGCTPPVKKDDAPKSPEKKTEASKPAEPPPSSGGQQENGVVDWGALTQELLRDAYSEICGAAKTVAPPRVLSKPRSTGVPLIDEFRSFPKGQRNATAAPVLYISGPMSGLTDFNFPAFKSAARKLRAEGYNVLDPSDFGANAWQTWEDCLSRDLGCLVHADCLIMLPGWELSRGACLERNNALALGKGILCLGDVLD